MRRTETHHIVQAIRAAVEVFSYYKLRLSRSLARIYPLHCQHLALVSALYWDWYKLVTRTASAMPENDSLPIIFVGINVCSSQQST